MLTVTDEAKAKLRKTLLSNTDDREEGLRLKVKAPGKIGLVIDRQLPNDRVIEHEGLKILIVEYEIGELLNSATLDVQHSPEGEKLTLFQK
jgi:Fe-S cluster assembly iron-binding protein IscA